MSPTIMIAIALIILVIVMRVMFKVAGLIFKLLLFAAIAFAIWSVLSSR